MQILFIVADTSPIIDIRESIWKAAYWVGTAGIAHRRIFQGSEIHASAIL
jgi:hypothetical protein